MVKPGYGLKFILGASQISSWKETVSGSQALSCSSVCDYHKLPRFCKASVFLCERGEVIPTIWFLGVLCSISGRCLWTSLKLKKSSTLNLILEVNSDVLYLHDFFISGHWK